MRGVRSLLALTAILAGLVAYVYFVEAKKPRGVEAGLGPKLFTVQADAITEITVRNSGGDTTALKKINGTWQITSPLSAPADEGEVSAIASGLATVDQLRAVDDAPSDLQQFGLASPRMDIAFRASGDKGVRHLLIGEKTSTLGDLYAKLPEAKKVFLIPGTFDSTFNRTTFDLRQKTVLAFDRDKVDRIEIVSGTSTVQLVRSGGEWALAKPIAAPADYGTAEGVVGRVQTAQMKAITVEAATDVKPYGLDKPQATVTLGMGSSQATLIVGARTDAGTVYARDASRPMVFTVETSLLDDLKRPGDEYRRKDVFAFRSFNATAVQITRGAETLAFEKVRTQGKDASERWRETRPTAKDLDAAAVDTFLTKLANQRAGSFVDVGPKAKTKTGLESPFMTVVVRFDEGRKEETVTFGRVGTDVYAAMNGQPGAAKIDTTELEDAVKALDAIR